MMKNFFEKINNALPKDRKTQIIVSVLVVLGLVGGIALANFSSNFVAGMTIVNLPGVPVHPESTLDPNATPGAENALPAPTLQPILETPEPWDGKSRVNILIMGLDARDLEDTAPRTDTMILFTLDPVNLTAGMISIPRDLWVKIPGSDYNKINTAYSIGEAYKLPGGGPGLAVKTVEDLLGVPIQYYAQIDFEAFIKFVDHIDGVKVDVPYRMQLDVVGTQRTVWVDPGVVTLPGELALAYVRMRNTEGGDFDRAQRQQQVILAIRDRILDFNMMPTLLTNANAIYADLSAGIRTNLTLSQALSLAQTIMKVPRDQIKQAVIDGQYVNFGKSPTGLDILRPIPDKIRELRDEIFYGQTSTSSSSTQDILAILQDEHANVSVRNASSVAGLAEKTAEYLKGQGINVVEVTDAGYQVYSRVTLYGSKPYTLRYLVDLLKITSSSNIIYAYDPAATVDIVVELGDDWAASNTLP
jgi:LCP family protein required for cell wall assembly